MATKRLYRSREDRIIAGVAGGLGAYFDIDPIVVRLLFVLLAIGGGSGVLLYIVCWIIMPDAPGAEKVEKDTSEEDFEKTVESKVKHMAQEGEESLNRLRNKKNSNITAGMILLVLGVLFLLQNLLNVNFWANLWPLVLVALGVGLMLRSSNKQTK